MPRAAGLEAALIDRLALDAARVAAMADVLSEAVAERGIPSGAVQLVRSTDRDTTTALLASDDVIDVIVPREGPGLVRAVAEGSRIPLIKHYEDVCSVYVDPAAELRMAEAIALNAKIQRPGVCNAMENLIAYASVAAPLLESLAPHLIAAGVELRGDPRVAALVADAIPATDDDSGTEYLDLVLAMKRWTPSTKRSSSSTTTDRATPTRS